MDTDKKQLYDKVKFENFVNSCKLEGIEIQNHGLSMEEVIKKYTNHEGIQSKKIKTDDQL